MDASTTLRPVIAQMTSDDVRERADVVADLLIDCVAGDGDLPFLKPLHPLVAIRWAFDVADAMRQTTHLIAARNDGRMAGLVILTRSSAQTQPHRAELGMLMVHRSQRERGIGRALALAAEETARAMGITLLTMELAIDGPGRPLIERLGWHRAGVVPGHSIRADGRAVDMMTYYKSIA